jgi:hypothetical protein
VLLPWFRDDLLERREKRLASHAKLPQPADEYHAPDVLMPLAQFVAHPLVQSTLHNGATLQVHCPRRHCPRWTPTALHCLMPAIIGNTFAASLRTGICPQRKESSSTSLARNPFNLNFFDSAQCLMGPEVALNWLFPYPI